MSETLWIGGCQVLESDAGMAFCKKIASIANCNVVATKATVESMERKLAPDEIEAFTESNCMVCTPDGTVMSESRFFCEREDHNFQITRLGRFPVK